MNPFTLRQAPKTSQRSLEESKIHKKGKEAEKEKTRPNTLTLPTPCITSAHPFLRCKIPLDSAYNPRMVQETPIDTMHEYAHPLLATTSFLNLAVPAAIVLVVAAVLITVLAVYRRRMKADTDDTPIFTLSDLRRMRDEGQLSDEEFERARSKLVTNTHRKIAEFDSPDLARDRKPADRLKIEPKTPQPPPT